MTQEEIANASILGFVVKNGILSEKGEPLSFTDRQFLIEILTDFSQKQVVKKCSQIGGSVLYTLKTLWSPKYKGWNIIYTFPTDDDAKEFVNTKTNPIIAANPQVFKDLSNEGVERKQVGERFIFYKGTVSKTAAIMTSADLLIHDEADRSDQKQIENYKSRLKASPYKGRWIFSNPTTEKGVVDLAWQKSDQREWMVTCKTCKLEQYLTYPDSIDPVNKLYICKGCKAALSDDDRRYGKWQPQVSGKTEWRGWHISHLMCAWITAAEVLEDAEGDQEYFYNFVLGEPYNPGDLQVNRSTILDSWTPRNLAGGQYYLGVDVGNIKHYALGSSKGLVKVGKFREWSDLDDMIKFYKPIGVIDAMPDNTMSRYYVANYTSMYMSFFQENKANPQQIVWWGEGVKNGIVYSNRNRILDQLIDQIVTGKVLFGLASDREMAEFIRHFETLRRVKVTDTKGIESYEWQSTTGVDHYVFATLYWYLARLTQGSGVIISRQGMQAPALVKSGVNTGEVLNLKEILDERAYLD